MDGGGGEGHPGVGKGDLLVSLTGALSRRRRRGGRWVGRVEGSRRSLFDSVLCQGTEKNLRCLRQV